MKRYIFTLIAIFAVTPRFLAQDTPPNDWENPAVISINKEDPHATLIPFAETEQAKEGDRNKSPYYKSLNGDWKFNWV